MNIAIHGAGRAGGALAIAASRAGHSIVSIVSRSERSVDFLAALVEVSSGTPDLVALSVSDDAIAATAAAIAVGGETVPTVHLSGAVPVSALDPIGRTGAQVGSIHPLQTFPDAQRGAERLSGAWIAVTAQDPLRTRLHEFAISLGCQPFDLDDADKPMYHAGAAAAANYTLTALDIARSLLEEVGVPFEAARPLVDAVIDNAFEMGPREALTGPIARGDATTVRRQLDAIRRVMPGAERAFVDFARATAVMAGTSAEIDGALQ